MESISVNFLAIGAGAVLSMIIGSVWYGPIFGKKWMEINKVDPNDKEYIKKMQKSAMPLYLVQFVLTVFQVLVLAHLVADTQIASGLERSLWIWAAFVIPTLAGASMWTSDSSGMKWSRFLIQAGYWGSVILKLQLLLWV